VSGTVYIVQVPQRLDPATGKWVDTMDFSQAMEYGELHICLASSKAMVFTPGPMVDELTQVLRKFNDEDSLLCTGDPSAIAIAAAIAATNNRGKFALLKWNSKVRKYYRIEVDLYPHKRRSE
jgi:hypothetical protein